MNRDDEQRRATERESQTNAAHERMSQTEQARREQEQQERLAREAHEENERLASQAPSDTSPPATAAAPLTPLSATDGKQAAIAARSSFMLACARCATSAQRQLQLLVSPHSDSCSCRCF